MSWTTSCCACCHELGLLVVSYQYREENVGDAATSSKCSVATLVINLGFYQCCASEIIFSGSGSYLDLNFGSGSGFESGSGLFMKKI
jgi:hypothetical protein